MVGDKCDLFSGWIFLFLSDAGTPEKEKALHGVWKYRKLWVFAYA